jgi:hypothetical protein
MAISRWADTGPAAYRASTSSRSPELGRWDLRRARQWPALVALAGFLAGCSHQPVNSDAGALCPAGQIADSAAALTRALCHFRRISEACVNAASTVGYHYEVSRESDAWKIRSIYPDRSCKTWTLILSASDARVLEFSSGDQH